MWLEKIIQLFFAVYNKAFSPKQAKDNHANEKNWPDKISRSDIVAFLETHDANELKIVHRDLADIDLSGLDLSGAIFHRCSFNGANLSHCILKGTEFQRAYFRKTNLSESLMSQVDFSDAYFRECNLANSSLYRAILDRVDFRDSNLEKVNLGRASLSEVKRLTPESLGYEILQDFSNDYEKYIRRVSEQEGEDVDVDNRVERWLRHRLIHGEYIYRSLKVAFANNGQYADSSWAYVRERQMRRQRHGLLQARHNFSQEYPENGRFKQIRRLGFYLKHLGLWLLDWLAELSCGYGERPLRPIFWAAATLAVFPIIYATVGGVSGPQTWLDYFNYSLAAFTTLGFDQFSADTPLAQTLTSIEAIVGISILALLMFVLGNRISRT
ncbi:hypothetical protein MNBD_CHLOROFLEXI01-5256 [hydrothermal vent metagenome]|uniref:Potassium channel domain-containing protein n=1 Tax=hydrothermal vent metagenome TaxID=652676 RepID=A0A3B0UJY1_9ZZZZ